MGIKMNASCIVIAGGKSVRMGRDKRFIKLKGKPILQHVLESAAKISDEIIIVVTSDEQRDNISGITGLKIVKDEISGLGPVMGVLTGLKNCTNEYAVVLPCDAPFIEPKIFEYLVTKCRGMDAAVPVAGSLIEPLHAVYNVKAMIAACENVIKSKKPSLTNAIKKLRDVEYVPINVLRKYDTNLLTFKNVNTPADLEAVLELDRK